jgi:hypothetical protein
MRHGERALKATLHALGFAVAELVGVFIAHAITIS